MFKIIKFLFALLVLFLAALGARCLWCICMGDDVAKEQIIQHILYMEQASDGTPQRAISHLTSLVIDIGEDIYSTLEKPQELRSSEEIEKHGIKVSTFKKKAFSRNYSIYVVTTNPISGKILLKAYNESEIEVGSAITECIQEANTGKYWSFDMPQELRFGEIQYFTLDYTN